MSEFTVSKDIALVTKSENDIKGLAIRITKHYLNFSYTYKTNNNNSGDECLVNKKSIPTRILIEMDKI